MQQDLVDYPTKNAVMETLQSKDYNQEGKVVTNLRFQRQYKSDGVSQEVKGEVSKISSQSRKQGGWLRDCGLRL